MTGPLKRLHADHSDRDAERAAAVYSSLLDGRVPSASLRTRIEVIDVASDVCWNAATMRARRASLKLPDALHLGTAMSGNCDTVLSDDKGLVAAARTTGLFAFSFASDDLDALLARVSTS